MPKLKCVGSHTGKRKNLGGKTHSCSQPEQHLSMFLSGEVPLFYQSHSKLRLESGLCVSSAPHCQGNPKARVALDTCLPSVCCLTGGSMFSSIKGFEGQQYSALKSQCQQNGSLFEDPLFAPTDESLFYQGNRIGRVHWKRPKVSVLPFPRWEAFCWPRGLFFLHHVIIIYLKGGTFNKLKWSIRSDQTI